MADIKRVGPLHHLRSTPTAHIHHLRKGRVAHAGTGQAFWFRPLTAALSEVPVDDREQPLIFHARTADFQDVTVQATITYRVTDPAMAAGRVDFAIDPATGSWRSTPLEQIGGLLTEQAQQHAVALLGTMGLTEALTAGLAAVRQCVEVGLGSDARLAETGVAVVGVRVVAVRAEPEVEKALRTPAREKVQQEADRATYERRAVAVERERAIAENELQNQIELARREEQLVEQRGANERRRATEQSEADRIAAEGAAARERITADAAADNERLLALARADGARAVGLAEADAEAARVAAYRDAQAATLLLLAARELAGNLPAIGTLNLTPDVITPLLARLSGAAAN